MSYVRNAWYVANWSHEVVAGKPHGMTILEEPIAIWRDEHGDVHAFEDRCVHRLAPLSKGRCEGPNLRCMYHGFLFNAEGRVISIPGQDVIPSIARVKTYPIVEQDSWIWVWMGDPARADKGLIPRVSGIDDPQWTLDHGALDYAAEARLINDNLTDFSHLAFVHAKSFASSEGFAANLPTVTPIDRGIRVERWAAKEPLIGRPESPDRVDAFLTYDYLVPGILKLLVRVYPPGTFEQFGRTELPPHIKSFDTYSAQAVTPTGKGTTRYFFSNGPRAPADPEFRAFLWNVTLAAFAEDRVIIEGQQRIIDATPGAKVMPAAGDKGTVLFNRLVERMVREESEGAQLAKGAAHSASQQA